MDHHRAARGLALCLLLMLGCARGRARSRPAPATLGSTLEPAASSAYQGGTQGAALKYLDEAGPAARAGLQSGDLIEAIDHDPVDGPCGLESKLRARKPGEKVKLTIRRGPESFEKTVELASALDLDGPSCDLGRAAACRRLGILYATGAGVPVDPQRAADLYQRACNRGNADACADLGIVHLQSTSLARARDLFEKACDGGSAAGCAHLAYVYATGQGVPQDDVRALALYGEACDAGDAAGCYNVGLHYEKGRGTAPNPGAALTLYGVACDLGSYLGCTNQGFLYEKGLGAPLDSARAATLYRRACEGNPCEPGDPIGCFNLGVMYRDGYGVGLDKSEAARYFGQSCDKGNAFGCANLADLLFAGDGVAKDEKQALDLFAGRAKVDMPSPAATSPPWRPARRARRRPPARPRVSRRPAAAARRRPATSWAFSMTKGAAWPRTRPWPPGSTKRRARGESPRGASTSECWPPTGRASPRTRPRARSLPAGLRRRAAARLLQRGGALRGGPGRSERSLPRPRSL